MSAGDPSNFLPPNLTVGSGMVLTSSSHGASWVKLDLPNDDDFKKIQKRLDTIEKRLAILTPDTALHDKFPALKEAYDHYKMIEKLVDENAK